MIQGSKVEGVRKVVWGVVGMISNKIMTRREPKSPMRGKVPLYGTTYLRGIILHNSYDAECHGTQSDVCR